MRSRSAVALRARLYCDIVLTEAKCRVPGCGALTQRASSRGLSELYCKRHIEFHRRHGSYWHRSISAVELKPYRVATRSWLKAEKDNDRVLLATRGMDLLMASSGDPISAYDIRGFSAHEKALSCLAHLRGANALGLDLLEIALAVSARVADKGPHDREFLEVNIAKALHRKASGTHRTTSGLPMPSKYPASAGKVLRELGHEVWDIASIVGDDSTINNIIAVARPAVSALEVSNGKRQAAEAAVASEILRVSSFGMGPQRLAQYELQLRRQHGLKTSR